MMKRILTFLFLAGFGMTAYFAYNVYELYFAAYKRVSDRELRQSLVETGKKDSLGYAFRQIASGSGNGGTAVNPPQTAEPEPFHSPEVDPAALSPKEAFDALRDRLEGKVPADQASLVGLMTRMTALNEASTEINEFILSELQYGKARGYFNDRGMLARYYQSAGTVLMQSAGGGDRAFDGMVKGIAAQEDAEIRRVLAVTYIERNPDKQDTFLKALEARRIYNPLVIQNLAPDQQPASQTPVDEHTH